MKKRFAVPLVDGKLCSHFGHCAQFSIIDTQNGEILTEEFVTPPPHEPGVLPRWLGEQGVTHIIAGGMGRQALNLFAQNNITVYMGAPAYEPKELVKQSLNGTLETGDNRCDH